MTDIGSFLGYDLSKDVGYRFELYKGKRALQKSSTNLSIHTPMDSAHNVRTFRLHYYWPMLIAATILYGSLIPFHFDLSVYQKINIEGLRLITWSSFDFNDLITNIAVYIPLGFSMMGYINYRKHSIFSRMMVVMIAIASLSLFIEILQTVIPERIASWYDVVFNVLGVGVGVLLFTIFETYSVSIFTTFRTQWIKQPYRVAAFLMICGLFCFELMPFDFIMSTQSLHDAFLRAQWLHVATPSNLSSHTFPFSLMHQIKGIAWFSLLGFLLAMSKKYSHRSNRSAMGYTIQQGVLFICLIECLQLFTQSHVFELEAIIARSLAIFSGAWCGVFFVGQTTENREQFKWNQTAVFYIFTIAAILQVFSLVASSIEFRLLNSLNLSGGNFHWLPFEVLWHQPFLQTTAQIISVIITFATLTITLNILFDSIGYRIPLIFVCFVVSMIAILIEFVQLLTGAGTPDITTPVLAFFATYLTTQTYYAIFPSGMILQSSNQK